MSKIVALKEMVITDERRNKRQNPKTSSENNIWPKFCMWLSTFGENLIKIGPMLSNVSSFRSDQCFIQGRSVRGCDTPAVQPPIL